MDALATAPLPALRRRLLHEPPRPARIRESPRARWYVVGAVCIGAFMGQLDVSIVTLALPRIGADLHAGVGAARWVSLSYLLVLAGTLVPVGRLADRLGRKLLYTHGFALFTLGSLLCGLAPSLSWLIAARVLQALGAALLQANSLALIAQSLPARTLARGLGIQGAAQAIGLALGPAIGGLLLAFAGWRLVFLVKGSRALTSGGPLLAALGLLALALRHGGAGLPVGLALTGAGLGAFTPVNNAAVMRAGSRARAGALSGILNTARCLGTALGVALAGALYAAGAGAVGGPSGTTPLAAAGHGLRLALLAFGAIAVVLAIGQRAGGRGAALCVDA
jgi:Major Facilitator Superfamily